MFGFRCYSCGATLGRGLPPMEALSRDQFEGGLADIASPIDNIENKMRTSILDGTTFEGMSTGSFCAFCLLAIGEFPSAMNSENELYTFDTVFPGNNEAMRQHVDLGPYKNRLVTLFTARALYKTIDAAPMLRMLNSLLLEGITYRKIDCWFPECTKQERILLDEDQSGCEDHTNFLRCFQILSTERGIHEFISMGHTDCECDSCEWIKWDNWDMDREEAETLRYENSGSDDPLDGMTDVPGFGENC